MLLLAVVLLVLMAGSLSVGAVPLSLAELWSALLQSPGASDDIAVTLLWELRLPRVLLAVLIGAGLASSGASFQAIFRNPLADPFVIGAASGAAFGVTMVNVTGLHVSGALFPLAAFVGALLAVAVVYATSAWAAHASMVALLLAGAAVANFFNALVWLILYIDGQNMDVIIAWMMGGLSDGKWSTLWQATPYLVAGIVVLWLLSRPLDALCCGEESAQSLGVPLFLMTALIVTAASLTTAAAVAAGGIIGFVGLIAPHIARLLVGGAHSRVVPASALIGACLLLLADDIARTAHAPLELPVGVLTALLGGPFFLVLLRQQVVRG